jgi:hypothetical protein
VLCGTLYTLTICSSEPFRSSSHQSLCAALHWTGLSTVLPSTDILLSSDLNRSRLQSWLPFSSVISIPAHCSGISTIDVSYSIASDTYSDADCISDPRNAHVDTGGDEALISVAVREICNQLRANDPRLAAYGSVF